MAKRIMRIVAPVYAVALAVALLVVLSGAALYGLAGFGLIAQYILEALGLWI